MFKNKKLAVVMPAYNAAKTIKKTYYEVVEQHIVDLIIIVDDCSRDETAFIASNFSSSEVKTVVFRHQNNLGYGGNQKTCYKLALEEGADIVIMVHPDYQYTPKLIPAMAGMIASGIYSCVLGSRVLGRGALKGGMPLWKYIINRCLTIMENFILGEYLSEYHTGYRAFSKELLENVSLEYNSDGFIFDNEMLVQIFWKGYAIGEVSCPTNYFPEASVISLWNSIKYGFGCLKLSLVYRMTKMNFIKSKLFS